LPGWTVDPSSTSNSSITPATGEWIGTEVYQQQKMRYQNTIKSYVKMTPCV